MGKSHTVTLQASDSSLCQVTLIKEYISRSKQKPLFTLCNRHSLSLTNFLSMLHKLPSSTGLSPLVYNTQSPPRRRYIHSAGRPLSTHNQAPWPMEKRYLQTLNVYKMISHLVIYSACTHIHTHTHTHTHTSHRFLFFFCCCCMSNTLWVSQNKTIFLINIPKARLMTKSSFKIFKANSGDAFDSRTYCSTYQKCRLAYLGVRLGGTVMSFTQIGQPRPGPASWHNGPRRSQLF